MNKQTFLDSLRHDLSDLPQEDVERSLEFYAEMIDDRTEDGLSEQEAVEQVGNPAEIAERIRMEMPMPLLVRAQVSKTRRLKGWEITLLALGSPVWLPVLLSVLAVLFSVYIVIWSVLIALFAVAASLAASSLAAFCLAVLTASDRDYMRCVLMTGCCLVLAGLAILLFLAAKALTVAVCRATAAIARKCKKRIAGRGSAS